MLYITDVHNHFYIIIQLFPLTYLPPSLLQTFGTVEYLLYGSRYHAHSVVSNFGRPFHSESLPRASLAISKDTHIVSV